MKLEKIELTNFKSFYGKNSVTLAKEGITTFIGPNGCGKSNLIDAIRWVLGEQSAKSLRGSAMPDVLFTGSQKHPAASYCEVSLVFDNEKSDTGPREVKISRRLEIDSGSEYLINGNTCRLQDIKELLLDSGIGGSKSYAIIEQGSIGALITAKATDRRVLIEEAAGIIKFNNKKIDAKKKLEDSHQNRLRLDDIINELAIQEASLKSQAAHAVEYQEKQQELATVENQITAKNWSRLNNQFNDEKKNLDRISAQEQELINSLASLDNNLAAEKLNYSKNEKENKDQQSLTEKFKLDHNNVLSEIKLAQQKLVHLKDWQDNKDELKSKINGNIQSLSSEIESNSTKLKSQIDKLSELKNFHAAKDLALKGIVNELQQLQLNNKNSSNENNKNLESIANLSGQLQHLNKTLEQAVPSVDSDLALKIENLTKELSIIDVSIFENEIASAKNLLFIKEEAVAEIEESIKVNSAELAKINGELQKLEKKTIELESKIQTENRLNKTGDIFLDYLNAESRLKEALQFLGQLNDLVDIDPSAPNFAIQDFETRLKLFVFADSARLAEIEAELIKLNIERLSLVFLDQVPTNDSDTSQFKFNNPAIKNLLGLLFNFEKSVKSSALAKSPIAGVYNFYNKNNLSALLINQNSQKELAELKILIDAKNQEQIRVKASLDALKNSLSTEDIDLEAYKLKLQEVNMSKQLALNSQTQVKKQLAALAEIKLKQENDLAENQANALKNKDIKIEIESNLNILNQQTIKAQAEILELNDKISNIENIKTACEQELSEVKLNLVRLEQDNQFITSSNENLKNQLLLKQNELAEFNNQILVYEDQSREFNKQIAELEQQSIKLVDLISKNIELNKLKESELEILKKKLDDNLSEINAKRFEQRDLNNKRSSIANRLEQISEEKAKIEQDLFEFKSLKPEELLNNFDVENFDIKKAYGNLKDLKLKIAGFNDVNLNAALQYKEISTRLNFLTEQKNDLDNSIKSLTEAILEIDRLSKQMFLECFSAVAQKFSELFPMLFGGGEARLEITNPDDIFNTAIEIVAKPPGKRTTNLNLLSGGEKALTAIALVFSIFLYRPSPFCVLDEVDAPLDIININRFSQLVKNLNSATQFIMITHNPKSMEVADYIYGVTMEDAGVSKVVSVNLSQLKKAI